MSTVQKVNFEPVTDILPVHRRDFPLADPTLAQPLNSLALVDGEWMAITSTYKIVRAADVTVLGTAGAAGRATVKSFPLWAERGRYDVQAIAGTKMPVLFRGEYEFDTRIFDATAIAGGGAAMTGIMQPLKVATIVLGGRNYCGLVGHGGAADTDPVIGHITRLPSGNGGKLPVHFGLAHLSRDERRKGDEQMSVPARVLNELFTQKLASAEGKEKMAEYGGSYVRDRLREVAFSRKIIPPENVTRADCQRSVNHDTLCKIVDIEPKSRAMAITFRGQPTARFIRGSRAEVAFFTISSEIFQKTEQELLAYEMPITKIIEENSVKDIQEIEDREFVIHIEAAVQALQQEANGGIVTSLNKTTIAAGTVVEFSVRKGELARNAPTNDSTVRPMQRVDIVGLFKLLDGNRLRSERILMTEVDWDDILTWTAEDAGGKIQSETLVDGYKYNTLLGRSYVRTIKTDILRPGNVYCFTKPEFFGKFYVLNNTKFYIDKIANMISFQAWEDIAMAVLNIAAVKKLELYSGDATVADSDGILNQVIPVSEESLGAVNNRVDQGLKFPQINQF